MRISLLAGGLAAALVAGQARALVWPDVPERIEHGLASADPAARRAAARDLVTLNAARATPLLLRALDDADTDVKLAAADAAIRLRIAAATPVVLGWLGGPLPALRIAACEVARSLPDPRAVGALARALGDAEVNVRRAAAEALGAYGGNADAVPPLLGKLDDASPNVRVVIARSLARLGDPRAVVPLVGKVQDSVPEVRQQVARALGDLGDPRAAQALLLQLRDNATEVRVEALGALGKLRASEAVDAIAALPVDRHPAIRQAAIAALGHIGTPAAVRALVAALGAGDDANGGFERTPVRDALVAAGASAIPEVASVLERPVSPAAATSAAWVLGALHARDRAGALVAAMRRGALPTPAALHALAGAGTSDSLPVVLEFASDASPGIRDEALRAAAALLDPATPDGRAVEPLSAALRDLRLAPEERAAIAGLLGRTGAARAAPVLAGLARAKGTAVRIPAIDALGTLGPVAATRPEDLDPLVDALADDDAAVRVHAAVALAEAGDARARDALVAKLGTDEIDRSAVLSALGGVLARVPSDPAVAALAHALDLAAGAERDAIAEALGRARVPAALDAIARLAASDDADDRKTAATLTAAQLGSPLAARATALARTLAADRDPTVRAQAAWALGTVGDRASAAALLPMLRADTDGAIDASAALGRIAARARDPSLTAPLCASLDDARGYVRAAALAGLSLARARCDHGATERRILESDPSDAARAAAALLLARASTGDADVRALARCATGDPSGAVATRCRAPDAVPTRAHAVDVYVVPDLSTSPEPRAPYVLVLADGAIRAGTADRRGSVFDPAAPEGDVTLLRTNER